MFTSCLLKHESSIYALQYQCIHVCVYITDVYNMFMYGCRNLAGIEKNKQTLRMYKFICAYSCKHIYVFIHIYKYMQCAFINKHKYMYLNTHICYSWRIYLLSMINYKQAPNKDRLSVL